jgi:hypothetical protein
VIARTCVGVAWLLPAVAAADDTHYQDQIVGEDALGMGGAFTGVADDASAAFYNPGGLALIRSSSISGSLSVYGYESREIENGLQTQQGTRDLSHEDYPTRGIGGGVVRRFGKRGPDRVRPFAFAMSTFIPFQGSYTYQVGYRVDGPYPPPYDYVRYTDRTLTISEDDKTVWAGPSLAWRVSDRLGIGLSAFLSTRTLSRRYDESWVDVVLDDPSGSDSAEYASITTTDLSLTALTTVLRLGVLWAATPRFRLGLMVSPPSIPVTSSGRITNRSLLASAIAGYEGSVTFDRSSYEAEEVNAAMPANARVGLAYAFSDTSLVAADGSVYLPIEYTPEHPLVRLPLGSVFTDNLWVASFERRLTTNANVGFETLLFERVPLRVGAFTNFSSAPDVVPGTEPMQPSVDMFGGSFAVGYRDEGYDISIGAAGMRGLGHALAFNADPLAPEPYSRQRYEQTAVYLYLAGAKKAAGTAAREFLKPE